MREPPANCPLPEPAVPVTPGGERQGRIDTLRAIACILLVSYHVVGYIPQTGMRVPEGSWLRSLNDGLGYVRMPMFTFLSGIVYAMRPVRWATAGPFILGKAKRLLIPLLAVGSLSVLMQAAAGGGDGTSAWRSILLIPLYSFAHFWYLQGLFLTFLLVIPLERWTLLSSLPKAIGVLMASLIPFAVWPWLPTLFSLQRVAYLVPFFLAGIILARFSADIHRIGRAHLALVGTTAAVLALCWLAGDSLALHAAFTMFVGVASVMALLLVVPDVPVLARLGTYSYSIYLLHVFGTAGSRTVLAKLGIDSWAIVFPVGLAAGLAFPLLVHLSVQDIPYISRMLLGMGPKRRPRRPIWLRTSRA